MCIYIIILITVFNYFSFTIKMMILKYIYYSLTSVLRPLVFTMLKTYDVLVVYYLNQMVFIIYHIHVIVFIK